MTLTAAESHSLLLKEMNERLNAEQQARSEEKKREFKRRMMKNPVERWQFQMMIWAIGKKYTDILIMVEQLEKRWIDAIDPDITIWDGITPARCRVQIDFLWKIYASYFPIVANLEG